MYFSDDNGWTWRKDNTFITPPSQRKLTLQENGVVELKDGRLWMYMRTTHGYQYGCYSSDSGLNWSDPKPTNLASPCSPATIERIAWTGDLVCVWNDHSGVHPFPTGRRTPLCVAISKDDGRTWSKSRVIESNPDGWYCYTSITFVKARMLLAYCAGDKKVGGLNRLKVLALPRDWLQLHSLDVEKLRERAVRTLRQGMREGEEWVKVHAAEELIWNGYPQNVRETFLDELNNKPGQEYRIGVWRIMAQAAGGDAAEREIYVNRIRDAFLDNNGPDRGHAGESLGKLGYAERLDEIVRIACYPKEYKGNVRWGGCWILANSGDPKEERYLAGLLDSKDANTRRITGYALRWLKRLTPETLTRLAELAANEPVDSLGRVYFLSALYVHSTESAPAGIKSRLLYYAITGDKEQKSEVCHALSYRGDVTDIDLLEKLMADENLDVRVNASNAVLKILHRGKGTLLKTSWCSDATSFVKR